MNNTDHVVEEKTKRITLGLILGWVAGVFLIISGLGFILMGDVLKGFFIILGGIILLPPVNNFFRTEWHLHLTGAVRFVIALILIVIGTALGGGSHTPGTTSGSGTSDSKTTSVKDTAPSDEPSLELISYHCSKEYNFFKITGQVKNISDTSLKNVEVVGSIFADDGTFITSADALISYNPILPGQTSPFEVVTTDNPASSKCNVEFKSLMGGSITTKRPAKE